MKIAILITCHNRRDKTLACIQALYANRCLDGVAMDVILVDDGSTDGTSAAVQTSYPTLLIIQGDGNLYWNGGMCIAFNTAIEKNYDYYLWLNDDTLLYPTAIEKLLTESNKISEQEGKDIIVVGATQDESTGQISYGGVIRPNKWKPTSFKLLPASNEPVECDAMNGNCVLIPAQIAKTLGGMEPAYAHAMGDLDYGLRARAAGFSIWVAPGFVGTCSNNSPVGSFNDKTLPMSVRLRKMLQPKGVPLASWRVFTRRHAGIFWPVYWLLPYAKVIITGLLRR